MTISTSTIDKSAEIGKANDLLQRLIQKHNIKLRGTGQTIVFAHGFGCDQNMWRFLSPDFESSYQTVLYDLMGCGHSAASSYDYDRYATLHGHADDLIEIIQATTDQPVIFVGHSVSAIVGMLATIKRPELFVCQIMVGPSPCYINDGDYQGGFSKAELGELAEAIESNYLGWSSAMAPKIMGATDQPELADELTNSFCRMDPQIAQHFAGVTFGSDHRKELAESTVPALIIQSSDDFIAQPVVGKFMQSQLPNASLVMVENIGHCPHMSEPDQSVKAIKDFLAA